MSEIEFIEGGDNTEYWSAFRAELGVKPGTHQDEWSARSGVLYAAHRDALQAIADAARRGVPYEDMAELRAEHRAALAAYEAHRAGGESDD